MKSDLMRPARLEHGYVIVLPGIEGRSFLNGSIVKGLVSAGIPWGIEIHDWTYGPLGYFWNLRDRRRHREQAEVIAGKIIEYRDQHPSQPVFIIGHSGGGAMTLFSLEHLPDGVKITGGIMLMPAISPSYDFTKALVHTTRGLWNFSSWGDAIFVGLGTVLCGTCDGRHALCAGMIGFHPRITDSTDNGESEAVEGNRHPVLHEVPYRPSMVRYGNLGGHFTPVNPYFVKHRIAPILTSSHDE